MKITEMSVNRPITAMMIFVALIVLGYVGFSKMPLDLLPDIEFPIAAVITEYKGVGPKEIESTVTRRLEESLAGINNIDYITSTSKEGMSLIGVRFIWGTDMSLAVSDIRERIDIIKKFLPEGIETPVVLKFDVSMMPIMVLSVSGSKDSSYLREYAEDNLKNLLEQIDGVASAVPIGGQKREVRVELVKNRMEAYDISIETVVGMVGLENMNVAGGDIKSPHRKYTLRTKGEFESLEDIRNMVVSVKNGTPIYLKDVARVYDAPAERKELVRLNGENGVVIRMTKQSDKNTVIVARDIMKQLEVIRKTLPRGMEITPIFNQAEYIERSIDNVIDSAWQGGIIAILVVFIMLRNLRSALILGLSIPVSIVATFIAMYYFDISLNMMSMGGLALGVGMLIDNSIVILENIFRFREKGARPNEAARLGADEMAMAITASTLTNLCVFIPFFFTTGLAGQLFRQMALTITFSQLCSLAVALTLVPMMSARFIKTITVRHTGRTAFLNDLFSWSEGMFTRLERFYALTIRWALGHRRRVVLFSALAVVAGLALIPLAGMEFMPEQDQEQVVFTAKLPIGTNLDTTESVMRMVEERVLKVVRRNEYRVVSVRAGYGEGFAAAFGETTDHTAKIEMRLVSVSKRDRSEHDIREAVRKAVADVPGVTFNFAVEGQGLSMGGGPQISIEIYGYDFDQAQEYSQQIKNAITGIPGLKDAEISREEGLPELVIVVNREKASKMGLNASYVANLIKDNVAGKIASIYRHEGKEYDIFVRLREEDRKSLDDIKSLLVRTPVGASVPLGNIIEVSSSSGPTTIQRKKQERVIYINCKAVGRDLNSVARDIQAKIDTLPKPRNFYVQIAGAFKDMQESFRDLGLALLLAIVLIYIIMAAQFESYLYPFIIMFSVPTLIFGVMIFLFLTGTTFNVVSFMGILMLSGIVVNNSIVLVDYTNILKARGLPTREALMEAGSKRLRPILMTTFTTILALVPMSLGLGEGAELSAPLARTVMGGMSSSFIFTLLFVPVVYSLFEDLSARVKKSFSGRG
ncbi:MAG TPA: efflux RND transporter permease subunit [Spirochaetota bacterium]|nr:efflux RND transporter permease subunit [Spirochaetota bacterium]OPZ39117.1 MAG: Swarming motility protein SwrC [Spirochaetes bacterium ADurb.BinA120]HPI12993.1 efflux RND transporter permease subunit [Spirochaetota bacterium]HPO44222.1 efflux RND transporter permease subunit [Spirochaetota bacterium]